MKYREPEPIPRAEAQEILKGDDEVALCRTLVGVAFHDPDWRWVQGECLRLLAHPASGVRGLAAVCLGHVARIHGQLDRDIVEPALRRLTKDPEAGGSAEDALGDIRHFLGP
jgi:hypothetical protein